MNCPKSSRFPQSNLKYPLKFYEYWIMCKMYAEKLTSILLTVTVLIINYSVMYIKNTFKNYSQLCRHNIPINREKSI